MKTLILAVGLSVASVSALAQGQLNFANFGAGANAPAFDFDGVTKLAGTAFQADLYWAPGTVTDSSVLTPLGQPAYFATSGYFLGGSRTINGQLAGATITGQVRIWDSADGNSWAAVINAGIGGSLTARVGESVLFQITLTQPPTTPNSLTGLNGHPFGFTIPEPSPLSMATLGLASMLILRGTNLEPT